MTKKMNDRTIQITKNQARNFFLRKQLLSRAKLAKGTKGACQVVEKLGYVQIDTINVIERSHHVVLFTRCPDYKTSYLDKLYAEKKLFEYWAHEASYIPMSDFRYYLPVMKRLTKKYSFIRKWIKEHRALMRQVKQRVIREGPLTARDFKDTKRRKRGTWWDWKPAKTALEMLLWQGDFMIRERRNFERVYDLAERVIPSDVDQTFPKADEENEFFIRRALGALGVATVQDINRYFTVSSRLEAMLLKMQMTGEILELRIKGLKKKYYCRNDDISRLRRCRENADDTVRFLSPFDNAIILRERTRALFDIAYALECYAPRNKRKYGYFCLPILWRNELVGRIDPKADRHQNTLIVKNLYIEKDVREKKKFMRALSAALHRFATFNSCARIAVSKHIPLHTRRRLAV